MKKEMCKNCTYYSAYYMKFASGFGRLNHGSCRKHKQPQKQGGLCGEFKSNVQREKLYKEIMLKDLKTAVTSINEIAEIMKEAKSGD